MRLLLLLLALSLPAAALANDDDDSACGDDDDSAASPDDAATYGFLCGVSSARGLPGPWLLAGAGLVLLSRRRREGPGSAPRGRA